ncbi:predicted protein [Botrytis cinerea T4]|uniref:Uncharacterized protein n=1 Tax=Botryotinia fuckeliana (strain T4) TaxID=999810 RepID=G2XRT5_BOTF4|nr:predicted protein [Botrytis cinerea T4]
MSIAYSLDSRTLKDCSCTRLYSIRVLTYNPPFLKGIRPLNDQCPSIAKTRVKLVNY